MDYNTVSFFIIGTELTRGIIEDKHTATLALELSHLGFDVARSVIVPDDGSIEKMLDDCINDSDVVIITGGLGPTTDDMTRKIIAEAAGVSLVLSQPAWDALYRRVGENIHGANERQAYIPEGFKLLENPNGTAPGFLGYTRRGDRDVLLVSMPGPPREMQPMFFNLVLPYLARLRGHKSMVRDEYSVFLISESKLEELCNQCQMPGVIVGDRFQNYKISLYLSGGTEENRRTMERRLYELISEDLMVSGEHESFDLLCDYLREHGLTLSSAESCTSGWFAKQMTEVSGSSAWYWGGANTYSEDAKTKLLGVGKDLLAKYSVYSHECVKAMAEGILKLSGTDVAIAVSGVAGPSGGNAENGVGTVYFGLASKTMETQTVRLDFSLTRRDFIRKRSTIAASILALLYLKGERLLDRTKKWQYI